MLHLRIPVNPEQPLNILCLGAHSDDIEIGCGGTVLKLIEKVEVIHINWIVFASNAVRKKEAMKSAALLLKGVPKKDVKVFDFRDGFLPSVWGEVKETFENLKSEIAPDIIFTHYRDDLHQDHRTINELTWNTFRDHLILEYEIPKYDGDLGSPNLFVPLEDYHIKRKKEIIINSFKSQHNKHWFDETLLTSVLRIRGMESAAKSNYAEAFYSRKMALQ